MTADVPVRERVVQQLVRKMEAMNADDDNGVQFSFVQREELSHIKQFQGSALSVLDISESYVYQTCYLQCNLRCGFEYWYQMQAGLEASTQLGLVCAALKKRLLTDCNLIEDETNLQLTENIRLVSDTYDIQGPFEKVVSGYMQFDVIYRTNKLNPYLLM